MIIHVVAPGENIYSIARQYGVPPEKIIADNMITDPNRLVLGQALVIIPPETTHIVQPGETLSGIAARYGVTTAELLARNPGITNPANLTPGQLIVISETGQKLGTFSVNGYAYPFIDREVLRRTLPYLTYLTVFSYGIRPDGTLIPVDDAELIALAREYGVAPIMMLTSMNAQGSFSSETASAVLRNPQARATLVNQVEAAMREKGYEGVDVDFEFIPAADTDNYVAFINELKQRLGPQGYTVMVALAPKTSDDQPGLLYEAHDYARLGAAADSALLMTYEWGYAFSPPMATAPINLMTDVVDYALTRIPAQKLMLGVPNYAYDWVIPHVRGSRAEAPGNVEALELAARYGAAIQFDETAQAPYFNYYDEQGVQHEVWFEDARSVQAKLALARDRGLLGIGVWQIMKYFPALWEVLSAQYNIRKVL